MFDSVKHDRVRVIILSLALGSSTVACHHEKPASVAEELRMDAETTSAIKAAAGTRVYWGHQSVGGNILEGLAALLSESQTSWPIYEVGRSPLPSGPALLHQRIGHNGVPTEKIDDFAKSVRSLADPKPKLAFMKLCFSDVNRETDVNKLIEYYATTLRQLKSDYPNIVFGHATVPLVPAADSYKDRLKRLAGIQIAKERDNLRRSEYNALLRKAFPQDPLFALDVIESTQPNGARLQFQIEGQVGYALASEYAGDASGHLNTTGAKLAAMELVRFVASAATH
jgi:hypothetical protein